MDTPSPLQRAIDAAGGVGELAFALKLSPSTPSMWKMRNHRVPAEYCAAVEAASGGSVRRWDLRPDDWHRIWPELIGAEGAPDAPPESQPEAA